MAMAAPALALGRPEPANAPHRVSPGKADDSMHSALYCLLASMIEKPRFDLIVPVRDGDVDIGSY